MRKMLLLLSAAAVWPSLAMAQDQDARDSVYDLGELQATARSRDGENIGGTTVTGEDLQRFDKLTIEHALDLVPGANAGNSGGNRNERLVFIRGFDRFQTTLSIDGVRVFLPADGRIDFARFLTADLAEVQVSKGYVSVIDGPGALGGAINLVTSKPTEAFELELRANALLSRQFGETEGQVLSARVGSRQGNFYIQASASLLDRDHFTLSDEFTPTAFEDGGERDHTNTYDWRANVKAGWTPNDTDEYSINYTTQGGSKNAPYNATSATTRFWDWPYWDITSVSFLSRTQLTDRLALRSRVYSNTFKNGLYSYDTAAQTTQSTQRAFVSPYDDEAYGGNLELDFNVTELDRLKAAFYYRQDIHTERNSLGFINVSGVPKAYSEPIQKNVEDTYSVAVENTLGLRDDIDVVVGGSYDWTSLLQADEISVYVQSGVIHLDPVHFARINNHAFNAQAAVLWRATDDLELHTSVSSRARFPTLFERFSTRMGLSIPNPTVGPERAINYEIGAKFDPTSDLNITGAVFYSDLKDALVSVPQNVPDPVNTSVNLVTNQTVNIGQGTYYGAEVSVAYDVTPKLRVGGNFTYIQREYDLTQNVGQPVPPAFRPLGVPNSKGFLYASWQPLEQLTLTPSVEFASNRWTVSATDATNFFKIGDYTLVNLSADWDINDRYRISVGGQNLTDENYSLTDGFPEAGRSFYAGVRARY